MATLYVENVPDELYDAIRKRARENRSSIAREVVQVLKEHVPTAAELRRRKALYKKILEFQKQKPLTPGPHPSAQEMLREDRDR
jgi:plasmid stability protein